LALSCLIAALEDDYWGVARAAVETLSEMGEAGHPAATGLISLAKKRLTVGPFHFEKWVETSGSVQPAPLLAVIAWALGTCAAGRPEAREVLAVLAANPESSVRAAAETASAEAASGRAEPPVGPIRLTEGSDSGRGL
jgi:hypothetical protein